MREHGMVSGCWGDAVFLVFVRQARERFVTMCDDKDVQELTWQAYMHKKLVARQKPMAHVKIFLKDTAHLARLEARNALDRRFV